MHAIKSLFLCVLLLGGSFLLNSCKSTEAIEREWSIEKLEYGGGGGFAGTYTYFLLDNKRQLFHKLSETKLQLIDTITNEDMAEINLLARKLIDSGVSQDRNGNMTFRIVIWTKNGQNSYKWADETETAKKEIADLYIKLKEIRNPLMPVEK